MIFSLVSGTFMGIGLKCLVIATDGSYEDIYSTWLFSY